MATREITETASQTQPPPTHQVDFDTHGLCVQFDESLDEGTLVEQALALNVAARALARCVTMAEQHDDGGAIHARTIADAAVGLEFLGSMSIALQEHVVNAQKARRPS